MFSRAAN